ncbi:MAG TPA: hypothetical protein PKW95_04615 [bacterium]|nr:hypothetical protein [bacterium]
MRAFFIFAAIVCLFIIPANAMAITVKGEVMHAANWSAVSGQTNVYKYENFDFPIDEDSSDYVQVYRNGVEQPRI